MEKIKNYIDELFKETSQTKNIRDLKEELFSDLTEKYSDLIKEGTNEKEAYNIVISSIGDIDELIKIHNKNNTNDINIQRKKTALIVSIAVGLYFASMVITVILDMLEVNDDLSGIAFLGIAAIPTCLLIYHFMSLPKYSKNDETMVENFKDLTSYSATRKYSKEKTKELQRSISSILWIFIVIIYIIISFMFHIWYISWIIFIIGALIESIISLIIKLGDK